MEHGWSGRFGRLGQNGREVHVVYFPNGEAFAAYRADPDLAALAGERAAAIAHTEVIIGEHAPPFTQT